MRATVSNGIHHPCELRAQNVRQRLIRELQPAIPLHHDVLARQCDVESDAHAQPARLDHLDRCAPTATHRDIALVGRGRDQHRSDARETAQDAFLADVAQVDDQVNAGKSVQRLLGKVAAIRFAGVRVG